MAEPIPAIINSSSGRNDARAALSEVGGFDLHEVAPEDLSREIARIIERRPARVVVAGGDGTLCTAAHLLAGHDIELAIVPNGTLNHFARDLGLPTDLREAAEIARTGQTRLVDAGRVNGHLFLNTSSVGAYERFVRRRERLERRFGYRMASLVAGWQVLFSSRTHQARIEIAGVASVYRTPLIFVGVGERELRIPALGGRIENGKRGLHVMIIRDRSGARLASLALAAAARGVDSVSRTPALDSLIVDRVTIEGAHRTVSVDGELMPMRRSLEYEFIPDALAVAVP